MPIYCLNGTRSSSSCKRSKNVTNELLGLNNYYISNNGTSGGSGGGGCCGGRTLAAVGKYQGGAAAGNNAASLGSTHSMVDAIDRLRTSVQNMRDTVLIPTRLSDLTPPPPPPASQAASIANGDICELTDSSDCSSIDCLSTSSGSSLGCGSMDLNLNGPNLVSLAMSRHNLYEQYKLLDLIDKIVTSDTVLPYSATLLSSGGNLSKPKSHHKRHYSSPIHPLFNSSSRQGSPMSNNNNNTSSHNHDDDNNNAAVNNKYIVGSNNNKPLSIDFNRGRLLVSSSSEVKTSAASSDEENNGLDAAAMVCCSNGGVGGTLLNECSLMKVKEKLEYHLTSLKTILNLMANNAEFITQKYLEDIQCDDRFKLDTEATTDELPSSGASSSSLLAAGHRHYYTSNSATI